MGREVCYDYPVKDFPFFFLFWSCGSLGGGGILRLNFDFWTGVLFNCLLPVGGYTDTVEV